MKVKTQEIEEKVHPLRKFILQAVAEATGMENKNRATKENPTSRILGLVLEEIFLGISSLGMSTFSFGLRFRVLDETTSLILKESSDGLSFVGGCASLSTSAPSRTLVSKWVT